MSTFLWGWVSASSGCNRPSSISRWTNVWSVVTCSKPSASDNRYARESPMCATQITSPSISRDVTVVPIPPNRGLDCTSFARFWLAFWISSASTVSASPS